ncbi:MAG: GGDEF domain-containing protein [Candidatus Omnitrophica bacterium]|nr:GGDEF domain-containing protein [Candidatus Omnitrophota bacterium]
MLLVIGCWALAMISALSWERRYTMACVAATLLCFLLIQGSSLAGWTGWVQVAALGVTPWLLAAQRTRDAAQRDQLHANEAKQLAQIGEAARSLLSLQTSNQQMEAQITDISDLYHVTKATVRTLHLPELFKASLDIAPRLIDAKTLRLIDLSESTPHVLRASRAGDGQMVVHDDRRLLEMEEALVRLSAMTREPTLVTSETLACALPEGVSHVAWAPLWRKQQRAGLLVADDLAASQVKTLSIVANQLSLQLSRIQLYQQVEALAVTDALTGVFVRRHFLELAVEELLRSKRHDLSCALLMIDLDRFKEKNDTFGHLVGDVVLRDVARLLTRNLREVDLIGRYGGEEFILLLIELSAEQAMPIADRLRQLVEVHPIRAYDELLSQTISVGVAEFPQDGETVEALIERADQALYEAKRQGRDRVVRWTDAIEKRS